MHGETHHLLVPGPGVVHHDMQEQYVHKNAKKVSWSDPGESNWYTCGWWILQGQSSQALQQTPHPSLLVQHKWCSRQCRPVEAPRDCCSVEGVVLQLVYLEQTGGSVQHIICFPHTFRMQAHEGQHISAVKPPWLQLKMHCAGQINQAIPGGGGAAVVWRLCLC